MKGLQIIFNILLLSCVYSNNIESSANSQDNINLLDETDSIPIERSERSHDYGNSGRKGRPTNVDRNILSYSTFNQKKRPIYGADISVSTINFLENARGQIPNIGCGSMALPLNSMYQCQKITNTCKITCKNSYTFPDGVSSINIMCMNREWFSENSIIQQIPPCQPVCQPSCQNNGICLEPGFCKCPENFSGALCENRRMICPSKPPMPKNAKGSCENMNCVVECLKGYKYPDGTGILNLDCKNGEWQNTKTGLKTVPNCEPTCSPPCANSGKCVAFNTCQCPKEYKGTRCEFDSSVCNITRAGFNGNFKCVYDAEFAKCKLSCPGDIKFDIPSASGHVMCKYTDGVFLPAPIPKCVFPYQSRASGSKYESSWIPNMDGSEYYNYSSSRTQKSEKESSLEVFMKWNNNNRVSELFSSSDEYYEIPGTYSLYVSQEIDVIYDNRPKSAICATWAGSNVKTFDGLIYRSHLSCSHTLVSDKIDATFDVILIASPYGSSFNSPHSLKVYWQGIIYTFENLNGTVRLSTPRKVLPIPVQVMGIKVSTVAQNLQINLESVGISILWDTRRYIVVDAGAGLWNRTGGICGSMDGNIQNDFTSKDGIVLKTTKAFTDSWKVQAYDDDSNCKMDYSEQLNQEIACDPKAASKAREICTRLLSTDKLTECLKPFNMNVLMQTCIEDYCKCPNKDSPESCNCDGISMLAKECTHKGVKLTHGWRNLEICPMKCKNGRIYRPCGPSMDATCGTSVLATRNTCTEGCFCPEGTVQHNDTCISPEICPCILRNKEFKSGDSVIKNCNTCTCKNGNWECTDKTCGSRCSAVGDPHYVTFDGKKFDFMGKCSYKLMQTKNFSIEAENVQCASAMSGLQTSTLTMPSCTKSVTINFLKENDQPATIKLDQGLITHFNNKEIKKYPKAIGDILIRFASSTVLTVEFPDGIRIWWDGVNSVFIDAPPSYRNRTEGLCGTFNSNTQDDFLTPEGDIETSVELFANKWRTKDSCDTMLETITGPHPCQQNPQNKKIAEKHCAWITEAVFEECHWSVDPETYYEDCMYDVCASNEDPAKSFCTILAAYGTECSRQGIKTNWRYHVKDCAIQCPVGQVYDECGDSCKRSCDDVARKDICLGQCVEGCRCPNGEYLNDNNECVPEKLCPCIYDGTVFNHGYKEVRKGRQFQELCVCTGGGWECNAAHPGDDVKYPPAFEMKNKCKSTPFAKFSNCVATEQKTCKNMHDYVENLDDCTPGCACQIGYVYDTTQQVCVLPTNCSCHHGGKSYTDGEEITEDCNICKCNSGNWKCTTNECESTCSVWGDSHFTTFDSHTFDFQGACDYVLAKGIADNGDGFSISIQNVLCGTLGVTCSKSVQISLTGSLSDTITLASDLSFFTDDSKSAINKIRELTSSKSHNYRIYKAGVFIVIEILPLSLQIKWDEGTRVYVKLGVQWKGKVGGLCGNYNGNANDDMKTPSLGLENSPFLFGHSWKLQEFCAAPTQQIDACKEHPERDTWAQLKCGVLKSKLFEDCHAKVPVEKFLKRCIFDTCACDQGGDCECLCTAVSSYAYECAVQGIYIKWRTPHFCPMQCNPHCSEYKACTTACPVETCDNFLDQGETNRMCRKENCFEGCHINECGNGMIYLNDSFTECVPKSSCKPICMEKDGQIFYEGDIIKSDDCQTCRCTKKKEVCSGVSCSEPILPKLTTELTTLSDTDIPMKNEVEIRCEPGWTNWINENRQIGNEVKTSDVEHLPKFNSLENVYASCDSEYITKIECRVADTHQSVNHFGENVDCDIENGLKCLGKQCHDYEIRVYCQCKTINTTTTPFVEVTTPKNLINGQCDGSIIEYLEFPHDCQKFLHCQPQTDGTWRYVEKSCGPSTMFNPNLNICDHIFNVELIKPSCGAVATIETTTSKQSVCPAGQVFSTCVNQCKHSCDYFVKTQPDQCSSDTECKSGCIDESDVDCSAINKLRRDKNTCVEIDECPCMSSDGQYVKPHSVYEEKSFGNCKTCQCIDNSYVCNDCTEVVTVPPPMKLIKLTTEMYSTSTTEETTLIIPTTVTPPLKCPPYRIHPLINDKIELPDSIFSASSVLGPSFLPHYGRLHAKATSKSSGSWSPIVNDQTQYLQINFGSNTPLFGVVMQGNPIYDQYVSLFKILYSQDGIGYHYLVDKTDSPQLFKGPIDSRTPVENLFKIPIEAKSVRIYPLKWHGSISMRVELLGCSEEEATEVTEQPTTTEMSETTLKYTFTDDDFEPVCEDEMGIENGLMKLHQVKASSIWPLKQEQTLLDSLKISSGMGWKPALNSPNEFIEFDFIEPRNLTGIQTKGGSNGWVTGYKIMYSNSGTTWNNILSVDNQPKIFIGNHDSEMLNTNHFKFPIQTNRLKVVPIKWEANINMRINLLGCFKPYPDPNDEVEIIPFEKLRKCPICNNIASNEIILGDVCKCMAPLYWNGTNCVERNMCPCVENHVSYPIGSKFEDKDCNECVCVLGGISQCKSKKCPPCAVGLRSVQSSTCYCQCEPCPPNQMLCPSSGDCIPENLWCNGIKNCEDDEPEDCTKILKPDNQPKHDENTTIIKTCPLPECPPGMRMKIVEKSATRKMSKIFKTSITTTTTKDMNKMTRTKVINKIEEYLPMAELEVGFNEVKQCDEFVCSPEPTEKTHKTETFSCNLPKCPDDYEVEVDNSINKPGECIKYTCVLRPQKDNVCQISGKSFITFDGTEFKYNICSHILARDLVNSSWSISLQLNCLKDQKVCRKNLVIKDKEVQGVLTILPELIINFNGFNYTVRQLQNSLMVKSAFIISQPGNTILIVSKLHGFWISYDDNGAIRIGVSEKYLKTVDGLCGYYNGNPYDDKRMSDGNLTSITNDFGDSWYDRLIPKEQCHSQVCPRSLQVKALQVCNTIKHPSFMSCGKAVNYKQFVSKCIEMTCDCLQQNGGDPASCKCGVLEGFVKQCLAVKPHVQLNTWRAIHQCEIKCPTPLVHSDCYKRRCEPTCETLAADDCPILPDDCFSGCYCPENTVRKGDTCIPFTECKDCICDSFGKSKYLTYDKQNFTFNGNCTYLLSRDIVLPGVHTFQVYVSMDACAKLGILDVGEHSSCAKAIHVLHGDHIVHMQRLPNKSIQIFVDGIEIAALPFKNEWIQFDETSGNNLNVLMHQSQVEIKGSFKDMTFSIGVPSIKYGKKMEGLCGDCNGDPKNDLQMNQNKRLGKLSKSTNIRDIVSSWQADEPKLKLKEDECLSAETSVESCIPLPPELDPCMKFFDEKRFGKCQAIVDPVMYVSSCQRDMCSPGSDQKGACESLAAYARECARNGICLNWRDEQLCPYDCPPHLRYESCGCTKTCNMVRANDLSKHNIKINSIANTTNIDAKCESELSEGCFCPPGKVLNNDKCLIKEHCILCDDGEHHPGDSWFKDKCSKCKCNENGKIICVEKECSSAESICIEGFIPSKINTDDCCPKYICVPEPKVATPITCPDAPLPECGPGQFKKQKISSDGCPKFICECKPISECDPLAEIKELKEGEQIIKDVSGCCPVMKMICDPTLCPIIPKDCENKLFELTRMKTTTDCCETYKCAPPKDTCIVQINGVDTLKMIGNKWIEPENPCITKSCNYGPEKTTIITEEHENCMSNCNKGFEYKMFDKKKCCGKCVPTMCLFEDQLYKPNEKWLSVNNCTHYSCIQQDQQFVVSSFEETCPDISLCPKQLQYKKGCCTLCKMLPESQKTCLPTSLAESETVKLVQAFYTGHGLCSNQQPIRGFTECHGSCESGSKFNPLSYGQDKICNCCSIQGYSALKIPLKCYDGYETYKEIQVPSSCDCSACNTTNNYEPLIDVRFGDNESAVKGRKI